MAVCFFSAYIQCKPRTNKSKKNLDNSKIVGAVFMDLSKVFNCMPHDFLTAEMKAYGFSEDFFTFLYSYLKGRQQSANINKVHSMFQILLPGVS